MSDHFGTCIKGLNHHSLCGRFADSNYFYVTCTVNWILNIWPREITQCIKSTARNEWVWSISRYQLWENQTIFSKPMLPLIKPPSPPLEKVKSDKFSWHPEDEPAWFIYGVINNTEQKKSTKQLNVMFKLSYLMCKTEWVNPNKPSICLTIQLFCGRDWKSNTVRSQKWFVACILLNC